MIYHPHLLLISYLLLIIVLLTLGSQMVGKILLAHGFGGSAHHKGTEKGEGTNSCRASQSITPSRQLPY